MGHTWNGDIALQSGLSLRDVSFSSDDRHCIPPKSSLRFLAIVETGRIPLHMTVGRPLRISTGNEKTAHWFSSILLSNDTEQPADSQRWWQSARADSTLGILVSVDDKLDSSRPIDRPRVSELLFFASKTASASRERPPTPPESSPLREKPDDVYPQSVEVFVLPLSSELLFESGAEPTPPPSPGSEVGHEATFLLSRANEQVSRPRIKKRRNINDAFDEAEERRRKAKRRGGEGVSAAAAAVQVKSEESITSLKHRRSISSNQVPIQNRPLSRSSSAASMRATSMRESSVQPVTARPSGLSQSQSAPAIPKFPDVESLEQKNRVFINKMVVHGMRMKGLRQSRSRRSRANSRAASPAPSNTEEAESDSKNDEEYKLLYNQVCKGAYFMFRRHIATNVLEGHIEALDEAVNRLLELYMLDPFNIGKDEALAEDGVTPSGRIPFGSSAGRGQGQANPFIQVAVEDRTSRTNTPLLQNWS